MIFHAHKFGVIQPDGFQYCSKCGMASNPICLHKWEIQQEANLTNYGETSGIVYILKCSNCGEMKNHTFRNNG